MAGNDAKSAKSANFFLIPLPAFFDNILIFGIRNRTPPGYRNGQGPLRLSPAGGS
jgi:hypothetical protein